MTQLHTQQCNSISTPLNNSYSPPKVSAYAPQVDDYVKWRNDEGWVYFKGEEYLTIEVSVKDKPDELVNMHKKVHCLVVCHHWYWNELQYVKNRREDTYKSQEHRYQDPQ